MQAFRTFLGDNDLLAYLAMMAPRLVELRRVLKTTGSIYLHCDPTASHYLKFLMDAVFGPENFRNEIIWKRSDPKGHAFTRYPSSHDLLLFYAKGPQPNWHTLYLPYRDEYLKSHYTQVEPETGRRYRLSDCLNPNPNRPNLTYEWKGQLRVWRWTKEKMQQLQDHGRLLYTRSGMPSYKRYLDEMPGTPLTSVWVDIPPINSQAQERLPYPTQKPVALLERVINASSNEEDIILDPFCGCGTAIEAARKLDRRWIGIDITHLAIGLIKNRLKDAFGDGIEKTYKVTGEPTSLPDAQSLARDDPFPLGLVEARSEAPKKGADKGIDGCLYFHDDMKGGQTKQVIFSVKAGHVTVSQIRDLRGVIEREKAQIGVLLAMEEPTKPMRVEAAGAGFYDSPWGGRYPRLQILTIEELLAGKGVDRPPHQGNVTFKKAPRVYKKQEEQPDLL